MSNIGKWAATATLDAKGFTSGVEQINSSAAKMRDNLAGIFGALSGGGSGVAGLARGVASVAGSLSGMVGPAAALGSALSGVLGAAEKIGHAINSWVNEGVQALRMQERFANTLGTTRSQAAALMAFGGALGIDPQQLQSMGLRSLQHTGQMRMDLASGGTGGAPAAALQSLGLDPRQFSSMNFAEQLGAVGDRLRNVGSAADRAFIASSLFGREWREMLPILTAGSETLQRLERDAREFGVTVDQASMSAITGTRAQVLELQIMSRMMQEGVRNQFAAGMIRGELGLQGDARQILEQLRPQQAAAQRQASAAGETLGSFGAFSQRMMNALFIQPGLGALQGLGFGSGGGAGAAGAPGATAAEDFAAANQGAAATRLQALQRDALGAADALRDYNQGLPRGASALERQIAAWTGIRQETAEALRNQLRAADAARGQLEIAQQRIQLGERANAREQGLVEGRSTPWERFRADAAFLQERRAFFGPSNEGRFRLGMANLLDSLPSLGASPLLGALTAGSSEVGTILQQSISPQVDRMEEIRAILEAMREANEESQRTREQIRDRLGELYDLWNE